MDNVFPKFQCPFCKRYSTQKRLNALTEKWKLAVDKSKSLTDLFTVFEFLPHKILIVKLHSYGFVLNALRLIHSYLSNKKQRTKINESHS